jgi:hypothetical protein
MAIVKNKFCIKKRTVILIIICCLLVSIGYVYLCFNPIIIHKPYARNEFLSDSLYNPIDTIDFKNGKNQIIIYINRQDIRFLPEKIKQCALLECKNNKTIEEIKKNFVFKRISNDIAETTDFDSRIFFLKNNKPVFSSKFIIEESISLHFKNTGWTVAINYDNLIKCFSEFKPVCFPIIKID